MNIGNITSDNFNLDGNGKDIQIEVYEQLIEQLQLELSGYRQAILEDKDMLGLKEENTELKKQLEEANEKIILLQASEPMLNYKKALEENQQKEFIKWLEDNWNTTQYIWYIKILNKYKEIIGVSDEKEN